MTIAIGRLRQRLVSVEVGHVRLVGGLRMVAAGALCIAAGALATRWLGGGAIAVTVVALLVAGFTVILQPGIRFAGRLAVQLAAVPAALLALTLGLATRATPELAQGLFPVIVAVALLPSSARPDWRPAGLLAITLYAVAALSPVHAGAVTMAGAALFGFAVGIALRELVVPGIVRHGRRGIGRAAVADVARLLDVLAAGIAEGADPAPASAILHDLRRRTRGLAALPPAPAGSVQALLAYDLHLLERAAGAIAACLMPFATGRPRLGPALAAALAGALSAVAARARGEAAPAAALARLESCLLDGAVAPDAVTGDLLRAKIALDRIGLRLDAIAGALAAAP